MIFGVSLEMLSDYKNHVRLQDNEITELVHTIKVIYYGFVHNIKYILMSFMGNYPVWIDEKNVCTYDKLWKHGSERWIFS